MSLTPGYSVTWQFLPRAQVLASQGAPPVAFRDQSTSLFFVCMLKYFSFLLFLSFATCMGFYPYLGVLKFHTSYVPWYFYIFFVLIICMQCVPLDPSNNRTLILRASPEQVLCITILYGLHFARTAFCLYSLNSYYLDLYFNYVIYVCLSQRL